MATTTQISTPTSTSIPWYRTRLFWGGVFVLLAVWALSLFILDLNYATRSFSNALDTLVLGIGGFLLTLYGSKFFGLAGGVVSGVVYLVIYCGLIYKTFSSNTVQLVYPLILVGLTVLGNIVGLVYLGGL